MKNLCLLLPALLFGACTGLQVIKSTDALAKVYKTVAIIEAQYNNGTFGTPDPEVVAQIKSRDLIIKTQLDAMIDAEAAGTNPTSAERAVFTTAVTELENYIIAKETK